MQLRRIDLGDRPDAWEAAGFQVTPSPDGTATVVLGSTTLSLTGAGGGFLGWRLDGLEGDLDGLRCSDVAATEPLDDTAGDHDHPPVHPNGISRIDHVVVRTGDVERTVTAFEGAGLEVRGGRSTSSYGAPMRQVFFWAGDVIVEVVGPNAGEPTTDEPTSIFGLALVADDLDATAAHLGGMLGSPKEAVQAGRRIAGLRGKEVGISLPVAVMSPHGPG